MPFGGFRFLLSSALIPCLSATFALGQDVLGTSTETSSVPQLVAEVRIDRKLSDEMVQFIATQSVRASMPRTRGRIEDLVRETCGYTSPLNERVFRVTLAEQGAVIDGDRFELADAATQVPSCLPDEQQTRLVGRLPLEGDSFSRYFERDLGVILSDSDNARPPAPINPRVELDIADLVTSYDYKGTSGFNAGWLPISASSDATSVFAQAEDYLAGSAIDPEDSSRLAYESWVTTEALIASGIGPQTSRLVVDRSLRRLGVQNSEPILNAADAARRAGQSEPRIRDLPFMVETCRASIGPTTAYCDAPASKTPLTLPSRTPDIITTLNLPQRAPNAGTIFANVPVISVEQVQKTAVISIAASEELRASFEAGQPIGVPEEVALRFEPNDDNVVDMSDSPLSVFEDVADNPGDPNQKCHDGIYNHWDNPKFKTDFRAAIDVAVAAKIALDGSLNQTKILVLDGGFADLGADLIDAAGLATLYQRDDPWTSASLDDMDEAARRKVDHGTAVSSIVMGGPGLVGDLESLRTTVRVRTKTAYLQRFEAAKTVFRIRGNLPRIVRQHEPDIVNLSIGALNETLGNLKGFTKAFNQSGPLFVLAAGNNGNNDNQGGGKSVSSAKIVPQLWATNTDANAVTGAFNVIVVAALDSQPTSGKLAWFSNFGEDHVYLAAPGCKIRGLRPNEDGSGYVEQSFNGTSFAAPIVSFVAALVHSVLPELRSNSPWVRARLLSSADINPPLRNSRFVNEGRILNPIAALRVYDDVITLKTPLTEGGPLEITGKILKNTPNTDPQMDDVCINNPGSDHTLLRLFEVPFDGAADQSQSFVDLIDGNDFMRTELCTLNGAGSVKLLVNGTEERDIEISNIADLKFAIRKGE